MRLMCAAAAALTIGIFLTLADENATKRGNGRPEQLAAIKKSFSQELEDFKRQMLKATDPAVRVGLRDKVRELVIRSSRDVLNLIEEAPQDETGFDGAAFVLENTCDFGGGSEYDRAITIVSEYHLRNPQLKKLMPKLCMAGPSGQKFFQTLRDKSQDQELCALADFYQGFMVGRELEANEDDANKLDLLIARANNFFEKALQEAPDARIGSSRLSEEVAFELKKLNNLSLVATGKPAPEVEGTDLQGKSVKLSSFKGKVVLLDFWGTFCPPCVAMIPHERELVKKLEGKPFVLVSVSCDDNRETLIRFLEHESMPWEHWYDGSGGLVSQTFRVNPLPTLFVIDHTGVIRGKWIGGQSSMKVAEKVEELVEDACRALK